MLTGAELPQERIFNELQLFFQAFYRVIEFHPFHHGNVFLFGVGIVPREAVPEVEECAVELLALRQKSVVVCHERRRDTVFQDVVVPEIQSHKAAGGTAEQFPPPNVLALNPGPKPPRFVQLLPTVVLRILKDCHILAL